MSDSLEPSDSSNNEELISPAKLSYSDAIAELEEIVNELDDGAVDVDALSEQFQRAIDIIEELDGRIIGARAKVDQLAPRLEALTNRNANSEAE